MSIIIYVNLYKYKNSTYTGKIDGLRGLGDRQKENILMIRIGARKLNQRLQKNNRILC
jgi:hypothetical protein